MPSQLRGRVARVWVSVLVVIAFATLVVVIAAWALRGKSDPAAGTPGPTDAPKGLVPAKDGGYGIHLGDAPLKAGEKRKIAVGEGYVELSPVEGAPPVKK
jgi:hypothetical protein